MFEPMFIWAQNFELSLLTNFLAFEFDQILDSCHIFTVGLLCPSRHKMHWFKNVEADEIIRTSTGSGKLYFSIMY